MDDDGGLLPMQPPEFLLRDIRADLAARLAALKPGHLVTLPPDTTWHKVSFRLTSAETVVFNAGGTSRQMDPGDFGMRSGKNNKPVLAWTFFTLLIAHGGRLELISCKSLDLI